MKIISPLYRLKRAFNIASQVVKNKVKYFLFTQFNCATSRTLSKGGLLPE